MAAAGARIRVPVAVACRVLGLTTQGYYKWSKDPVSQRDWDDAHAIHALLEIHEDDPTLGYRFLTDELADVGIVASENRVWRLCSTAGVFASHRRRRGKAGKPGPPVHDDLLAVVDAKGRLTHQFVAGAPNEVWLTDITEHPTGEGKLYLCAIKDVYSNRIVGYSIDSRMKSSLAASAIRNAVGLRSPDGTICHSDRGSQGEINRSSQHLDHGGVRWDDRGSRFRRRRPGRGGSGPRTGRCERRCAHRDAPSHRELCNGSSGA
jgi:putative transposase